MGRSALPKAMWQQAQADRTLRPGAAAVASAAASIPLVPSATVASKRLKKTLAQSQADQHSAAKRAPNTAAQKPKPVAGCMNKSHAQPGAVRIIGGQWKRRKLPVPYGLQMPAGLRPTADRVRETLFNWLGQDLSGWRCLDVCAGTGALGFEAASRGAANVTLVEQHPAVVQHLRAMRQQLDAQAVHIVAGDALAFLRQQAAQAPASVDVLFFDPPYSAFSQAAHEEALRWAADLLRPNGCLYLEAGREWTQQELAELGWTRWRYLKAGAVHAHLLRLLPPQGFEA